MKSFNITEFESYIKGLTVKRKIKMLQLHHTYSPSYKNFTGNNHMELQKAMKNHHVKTNGWADIGQHFTIFPDGIIMTGRSLDVNPAGIYGANTGAICIECLGNFDKGGDKMREEQKKSVVAVLKTLLDKFSLNPESNVTYHAWWASDGREIGDYVKGHSVKTCPGTDFFGGNTLTSYESNLMPLVKKYKSSNLSEVTTVNDIIWELGNAGIITDSNLWIKKSTEDINIYWLCRKMANKLRGVS